jgi:hypothetical protein
MDSATPATGASTSPADASMAPADTSISLAELHTELGIHIDPDTAATRWRGERMDYDLGVWVLSQPHAGAGGFDTDADVSAETFDAAQWQSEGELDYRPWWKDIVHS